MAKVHVREYQTDRDLGTVEDYDDPDLLEERQVVFVGGREYLLQSVKSTGEGIVAVVYTKATMVEAVND